ncbi:uncharacterized protein DNG_05955 [Cephalotrichum gorgonifer]|uniref:Uncharacterized protein n=1 Tax=Cephalotrichum gorgonifer TaxID=2041049 RepID=A0AAE8N0T3_9PEZI|nr:uncharacterized protein DNG_05955 [Cephalotrichum gorgonifer]
MDPHSAEDGRLLQLCRTAFHAEHQRQFADAQRMHREAVAGLTKLVDDAGWRDRERKRVARKQIKFHATRVEILRPIVEGRKAGLDVVLPTSLSMQESLMTVAPNGRLPIGLEEVWLSDYTANKAANPTAAPVADTTTFQHLLQTPVPPYTPTLDPSLPDVTYHIYSSGEGVWPVGHIFYFKAKSMNESRETLYVLQAPKRRRYQIPLATLHRSTEFTSPCVQVQIEPVKPESQNSLNLAMMKGRSFTLYGASKRPIVEKSDRVERKWGNRRFHFAGREFVWETAHNPAYPDTLYEVEKSWPKPGSKTGKREHKRLGRRLVWGDLKTGLKKVGMIHMVGGLDQVFVEYVLASQLARLAVIIHGHD